MKDQISNCNDLRIESRKDLTSDGEYIDKDIMKKHCKLSCMKRETCISILKLLENGERKKAENLLVK